MSEHGPTNTDPRYILRLDHYKPGEPGPVTVKAHTTEDLKLKLGQKWTSPFGTLANNAAKVANSVLSLTGNRMTHPLMSALSWESTEPVKFQGIKFEWHADTSPFLDVMQPLIKLIEMTTPSYNNFIVTIPGPSIAGEVLARIKDAASGTTEKQGMDADYGVGEYIVFNYGSYLRLKPVVITAIDITIPNKPTKDGMPTHIIASVDISAFRGIFREDVIAMLTKSSNGLDTSKASGGAEETGT